MNQFKRIIFCLLVAGVAWGFSAEPTQAQITISSVGINGAPCAYNNISDAIAAAKDGDTIYISAGTYFEQLGDITKSLTFVPSTPGLCILEDTGANSFSVKIDGTGTTSIEGGVAHVKNKATVTFRHMQLRNGSATNGGILAISENSKVILDDVNILSGTSSKDGGGVYVTADPDQPSTLHLINGSNLYINWAVANGGAIALVNSILIIDRGNIGLAASEGATFFNQAVNGGGIYASNSSVTLNADATVRRNTASGDGAGIYADDSELIINGGQVIDNEADNRGGGLFLDGNGITTLTGATIQGNIAFREGGGIYTDSHLNVTDGILHFNSSSTRNGGGIYADGRTLTIDGTTIADNSAARKGGGIFMTDGGTLNVSNARFDRNITTQRLVNDEDGGGAIYANGGSSVTVAATLFEGNQSDGGGGAIFVADNSPLVVTGETSTTDAEFEDNMANSEDGGAIKAIDSDVTLTDVSLKLNEATTDGAGLSARGIVDDINVTTTNTTFNQNTAVGDGGGAYIIDAIIEMTDYTVINNRAANGAGLYIAGELAGRNGTFTDGLVSSNTATIYGGGIHLGFRDDFRFYTFDDVRISNNQTGRFGGGLYTSGQMILTLSNCEFDSNRVTVSGYSGGAISAVSFRTQASMTIQDCEFTQNTALNGGGAIDVTAHNAVDIVDTLFSENSVTDAGSDGGAINMFSVQRSNLVNVRFVNNSAVERGGALYTNGAGIDMLTDFNGSGLSESGCDASALAANVYCSEFVGNSAEIGGAYYVNGREISFSDNQVVISDVAFQSNKASNDGTALYARREPTDPIQPNITLTNTLFVDNRHPDYSPLNPTQNIVSVISLRDDTRFSMHSSTITDNRGSPITTYPTDSTQQLVSNSIIYGNYSGTNLQAGILTAICNTAQSPAPGTQSYGTDIDPIFSPTLRGSFRLASFSPAVDACPTGPDHDLDGNSRPAGSSFDQGAFEFGATPTAVEMREQVTGDRYQAVVYLVGVLLVGVTGGVWFRPKSHHTQSHQRPCF